MTASKIVLGAASGGAGGAGLDVDEVFSTHLATGNNSTQTITNGIDLSGEGGLVWTKTRSVSDNHRLTDTERGAGKGLDASNNYAEWTANPSAGTPSGVSSFNSNGFVSDLSHSFFNNEEIVSWTFRKAPNFFDVQTGTCSSGGQLEVNHNLGSSPAMVIVKGTNVADDWYVYHISQGASKYGSLNTTSNFQSYSPALFDNISSTTFRIKFGSYYANQPVVLYLFAHNNSDGGFGPDGDQDIIKCGSFNTPSSGDLDVSLGFEPQFILFKRSDASENWGMRDVMRGMSYASNGDARLWPNLSNQEFDGDAFNPTPTGFTVQGGADLSYSATYIYMAIRRGPLAVPEDATKVFAIDTFGSTGDGKTPGWRSGFPVDMALYKIPSGASDGNIASRLTAPKYLRTNSTAAESTDNDFTFDYNNGWYNYTGTIATYYSWMWKRAPGYFDVRAYDGGTTNISHGLGVNPEMIWVKRRDGTSHWAIYHKDTGVTKTLQFDTNAPFTNTTFTGVFDETFRAQTSYTNVNYNNMKYVAYLFATAPGVSKVGSYTGNGSSQTIDCGFSNGARFVLIKGITTNGYNWCVWDSARGIVSGNDPKLELDTSSAQQTGYDFVDPESSGFSVTNYADVNGSGVTYLFYAIA